MKLLEVEKLANRKFSELSAGQQQRVLIALSMISMPRMLILDEPTVGVDIKAQQDFYRTLKKLNGELGVTILMITHEVGVIPKFVKNVMCINRKVCCFGKAAETEKLLKKVYGEDIRIFEHE
jgi:zinc transport system ATP-binding protein